MSNHDDLLCIIQDCIKIFDENIDILSDVESSLNSGVEDRLIPYVSKANLIDMAYQVADSARIKKAGSNLMQRHLQI